MAEKVKLSKDGHSIDFVQSESLPTSLKKFRQSPEIEGFYRFIFENDLQKEAYEILDRIVNGRKAAKKAQKTESKAAAKLEAQTVAAATKAAAYDKTVKAKPAPMRPTETPVAKVTPKPVAKAAPVTKPIAKVAAKPVVKAKAPVKVIPVVKKKVKR